jgi:hypothetical protein
MAKLLINRSSVGLSSVLLVLLSHSVASAQNVASTVASAPQVTGSFLSGVKSTATRQPEFMRRLEKLRQFTETCLRRDDLPATPEATRLFIEPCINDHLASAGEHWRWDARRDDIWSTDAPIQRTATTTK